MVVSPCHCNTLSLWPPAGGAGDGLEQSFQPSAPECVLGGSSSLRRAESSWGKTQRPNDWETAQAERSVEMPRD